MSQKNSVSSSLANKRLNPREQSSRFILFISSLLLRQTDTPHQILKARIVAQAVEIRLNAQKNQLYIVFGIGFLQQRKRLLTVAERSVQYGQRPGLNVLAARQHTFEICLRFFAFAPLAYTWRISGKARMVVDVKSLRQRGRRSSLPRYACNSFS